MKKTRAKIRFSGLVQGVGFRFFVRRNAEKLGVGGVVKNMPDGTVEAVFEGPEEAVQRLAEICKEGPRGARVQSADIEYEDFRGEFSGFGIES